MALLAKIKLLLRVSSFVLLKFALLAAAVESSAESSSRSVIAKSDAIASSDRSKSESSKESTRSAQANLMPLSLGVVVNGKYAGQVNAKIDPRKNTGVVEQERFKQILKPLLGKKSFDILKRGLAGLDEFVDFDRIENGGLQAKFDPLSLSIEVSLKASDLVTQSYALKSRSASPNPDLYQQASNFTAGLNIAASQVLDRRGDEQISNSPQVALNGLINLGGFGGVTVEGGARYNGNDDEPWDRTAVFASKDFFNSALRLSAGEITPRARAFQGSQRILGLGLHRAYSNIRPFQIVRPTGRSRFSLDEDSRVEVYVNEVLVDTVELNQGSYSLSDFPITSRSNDIRLEIIGRSGRREVLNFDVYGGSELLAPGLSDFGVFFGKRQGLEALKYSEDLSATAYYRKGLTGQLSAGATLQATDTAQQLGLLMTYGSDYGLFDLELAGSYHADHKQSGSALRLSYRNTFSLFAANDLRLSANGEYRTEFFQSAFDDLDFAPQKWSNAIQASWIGQRGWSATMGMSSSETRGLTGGRSHSISGNISRRVGDFQFGATFSLGDSVAGVESERFGFTLGYRPAGAYSSTAQYNSTDDQMQFDFRRRSKAQVEGLNISAQMRDSERDRRARLAANYNHNRFESSIQHSRISSKESDTPDLDRTQWRIASFVGVSNGSVGIGRPIQSGFVLAKKHKSLRDSKVEILNGSQFVSRPGLLGPAVIPISRPYSVNRFEVSVDPLPLGYDIGEGAITVFPGHGSSFTAPVGSDASRTAMGFLIKNGEPLALVSGMVSPQGAKPEDDKFQRPLFTNRGGRFVADRLRAGVYEIIIEDEVFATFEIDKKSEGLVNLGKVSNETN